MEPIKISSKALEPLCCVVCDTMLFAFDNVKKKYKPLPIYREATLHLSSGARMVVGICETCRPHLDDKLGEGILHRHRVFWNNTLAADRTVSTEDKRRNVERNAALKIERLSYAG